MPDVLLNSSKWEAKCLKHFLAVWFANAIDATFLKRLLALGDKIWNETNLQDFAQDWMFKRTFENFQWNMKSD